MVTPIASSPEFQVNTYTSGEQNEAKISALGNGGFVVTWTSYWQGGAGSNIYAQMYDSTGATVGDEFKVNTDTSQLWQQTPAVSGLGDGGFVITWQSFQQDGSENGVYGQRYDSDGVATGGEFAVNTTTANWQWESAVTSLGDGGFVVSWSTFQQDGDSTGIAGQRYDATGTPVGTEFLVNTYTTGAQQRAEITGLGDGGFVITWVSQGQDEIAAPDDYGIYGQRYDAAGAVAGGEFLVNTTTVDDQTFSSVAALPGGGFVVAWASWAQDGVRYDIFSQMYDAQGAPVGTEFQVSAASDSRQLFPTVTALDDGGFVIIWSTEEGEAASGADAIYDISGQRFDAAGQPVGQAFAINTTLQDDQTKPIVTTLSNGDFVVTWESIDQDQAGGPGVIGRMFSVEQTLTGTAGNDNLASGSGKDILRGLAGDDTLAGGAGNDTLRGGQGADALDGGAGRDTAVYASSSAGVTVDLAAGTASGGDAQGDTLTAIEKLVGSGFDDNLSGDANNNVLVGRGGDDNLSGAAGRDFLVGGAGADRLDGGAGFDTARYAGSDAAVSISLAAGTASGGQAEGDTLISIERLVGSAFDDLLVGNGKKNTLNGNDGDDILSGGRGSDRLLGGNGDDTLTGGRGNDRLTGGTGEDTFVFKANSGADRVTDFQVGIDTLNLKDKLWGEISLSNGEVISQFASVVDTGVVFDFGDGNTVTLTGLTSTAGLEDDLLIF